MLRVACMPIASTSVRKPDVVVFSDCGRKTSEPSSSKIMRGKSFMVRQSPIPGLKSSQPSSKSSKVYKLRDETQDQSADGTLGSVDDKDDEL